MLVIDASAVVELLLERPAARRIAARITARGSDLHAPHLLDVEVLSALRALTLRGELPVKRAEQALDDFESLPVERYPHRGLIARAWDVRSTFSPYDGVYVALAEALAAQGATLLTADGRLARAAGAFCPVELVGGS